MTEVLHSPSHFPSSPSTTQSSSNSSLSCAPPSSFRQSSYVGAGGQEEDGGFMVSECDPDEDFVKESEKNQREQLSLLALLVTIFRKSLAACKSDRRELCAMEIGWPSNVRHVAHVTFDRFNGFLGLPVEFEPEVPRRAPSASATVFGVSTESMQLSYDSRGNSVPTILLLMQRHLYSQGGLQAEGIFRINAENSQEEYVRDQLNRGVIPDGIDIHCLAGLIKAWFRELPTGVLDSLSPEKVMQCQTEEDCAQLARHLPYTEAALLDWAINLMADVVKHEHVNKMNARNIAMVFAPNMTQMADPLTALMYAVQVMNFLKTLILRTLREREDSVLEPTPTSHLEPFDENDHQSPLLYCVEDAKYDNEKTDEVFVAEEPVIESSYSSQSNVITNGEYHSSSISAEKLIAKELQSCEAAAEVDTSTNETYAVIVNDLKASVHTSPGKSSVGQSSSSNLSKINRQQSILRLAASVEKTRGLSNLSCIGSRTELIEAWR
ncbi:gtpase activating protein, putative [Ricinus communis]|uniref:Gtpase activating protein, putative n=1 Tax=Ricinus communis TaxID=3988 RepID=B9SCV2_RICCO|nr:gtpase activating protein, putative [Ricinus communis]|eukprot:XP_002523821.1 rho GTPase-activating protein 5 [Ricinus communis]